MLPTASDCEFDVDRGPDWLLIRVRKWEPGDMESSPLAEQVWRLMEQHLMHRLVLELDQVPMLNSRMIGQLIKLYRRISECEGVMRLCGLTQRNRDLMHQCRLDERLPPYQDRQDAVLGDLMRQRPR
jgi:anti-anti-sigma factor